MPTDEQLNQPQEAQQEPQSNPDGQGSIAPVINEPAQDSNVPSVEPPQGSDPQDSPALPTQPDPVVIPDSGVQVPLEPNAPEPVVVPEQKEQQDSNIQKQGIPAGVESIPTVEVKNNETQRPPQGDNSIDPNKIENLVEEQSAEPKIVEKIVEIQRPVTEEEKKGMFFEELGKYRTQAQTERRNLHERRLQEVLDFIKFKANLVANQEIEEHFKVSDTTATRWLNELIKRGEVIRIGAGFQSRYRLTRVI